MTTPLAMKSSTSRHRTQELRRSCSTLLPLLVAASGITVNTYAGSAPNGTHSINLLIDDAATAEADWSIPLTGLTQFNETTGAVTMHKVGTKLDFLPANGGTWSWQTIGTLDPDNALAATKGINWSSTSTDGSGNPLASVTFFELAGNVDPIMSYGFTAKNNTGSTQTFTFTYGESVTPTIAGSYMVNADIGGSLTNTVAGSPTLIAPVLGDMDGDGFAEMQVLKLSGDNGTTFFTAGVDVGQAFLKTTTSKGTELIPLDSSPLLAGTTTLINYWEIETKFSLTPGDVASISGFAEIQENGANIPEPSTYALLIAGLTVGGAALHRRRKSAD